MQKREDWFDSQLDLDPRRLVFIDESVLQSSGRSSTGAKGSDQVVVLFGTTGNRMTSIVTTNKPFRIEKITKRSKPTVVQPGWA
jgi:hypothetical protein